MEKKIDFFRVAGRALQYKVEKAMADDNKSTAGYSNIKDSST